MKTILMSIKPKWVAKILNGEKTIEVRKRFPKDYRGWVYIYCTHGNKLFDFRKETIDCDIIFGIGEKKSNDIVWSTPPILNGKVVARFYCDNVEEIQCNWHDIAGNCYDAETFYEQELLRQSCLSYEDLDQYLQGKTAYAIHISQLEIFDKPKELWEFDSPKGIIPCYKCLLDNHTCKFEHCNSIYKAPQSWQYIEVEE